VQNRELKDKRKIYKGRMEAKKNAKIIKKMK